MCNKNIFEYAKIAFEDQQRLIKRKYKNEEENKIKKWKEIQIEKLISYLTGLGIECALEEVKMINISDWYFSEPVPSNPYVTHYRASIIIEGVKFIYDGGLTIRDKCNKCNRIVNDKLGINSIIDVGRIMRSGITPEHHVCNF